MVRFIYSEQVNKNMIAGYLRGLKEFCEKQNLVYFEPTEENKKKVDEIMKVTKFPEITGDVDCYIRYWGTWGMYHPDDGCISICPINIERAPGGLVGTVKHEIAHLLHPEANSMEHQDKEDYVNSSQAKQA